MFVFANTAAIGVYKRGAARIDASVYAPWRGVAGRGGAWRGGALNLVKGFRLVRFHSVACVLYRGPQQG